jgi:hypothetical protein
VDQAADHRAAVADGGVGDVGDGLAEQGDGGGGLVVLDPGVAGQGADPDRVRLPGDLVQGGQPVDVDQVGGGGQPHVEQRDQALAAGQDLAVVAHLGQHGQRLGDRLRPVVGEHRWLHRRHHLASWQQRKPRTDIVHTDP